MQPTLFAAAQWTVSSLTRYIRDALEGRPVPPVIPVEVGVFTRDSG